MVGILVSYWDGLFSGAMLVSRRLIENTPQKMARELGRFWEMSFLFNLTLFVPGFYRSMAIFGSSFPKENHISPPCVKILRNGVFFSV